MLIGFIGSPGSGKTTTAAMTFADLKNIGISSEFIPEQARLHIAEKRLLSDQTPGSPVKLNDQDQMEIIHRQAEAESMMIRSCGPGTFVVTDSSTLNSLLYMSDACRKEILARQAKTDFMPEYDLLFYCSPVKSPRAMDPNRLHDEQQSLEIDSKIPDLLKELGLTPTFLLGTPEERRHIVTRSILERLAS